jgi:hypothetical protein
MGKRVARHTRNWREAAAAAARLAIDINGLVTERAPVAPRRARQTSRAQASATAIGGTAAGETPLSTKPPLGYRE